MKNRLIVPLGLLLLSGLLTTCIEPYNPKVSNYEEHLVVDALITDEEAPNYVTLTKTTATADRDPEYVTEADVTVSDDLGNETHLSEVSPGVYRTDSTTFRGEVGRTYTLHISTIDGKVYQSEPSTMLPVRAIDEVYFGKDYEPIENSADVQEGVRVYIDSKGPAENIYFRWTYLEYWKFVILFPKRFDYINSNTIVEIPITKNVCFKHAKSDDIIISAIEAGASPEFDKKPVFFIPSDQSDRLLVQYCVDVKQLSISKKEYEFWKNMQQISATGGDIFDKPPFTIISNIYNTDNDDEAVLGYFQVSSVSHMRKYLKRNQINDMHLKLYSYDCELIILGPKDPQPQYIQPPVTFDKIYNLYTKLHYIFIQPDYNDYGALERLEFAKATCADCTLTGSLNAPDFWVDLY